MAGAAVVGNLVNVTSLSLLLLVAGLEIKLVYSVFKLLVESVLTISYGA